MGGSCYALVTNVKVTRTGLGEWVALWCLIRSGIVFDRSIHGPQAYIAIGYYRNEKGFPSQKIALWDRIPIATHFFSFFLSCSRLYSYFVAVDSKSAARVDITRRNQSELPKRLGSQPNRPTLPKFGFSIRRLET